MHIFFILLPLISALTIIFFGRFIYSVMTGNIFCHSLYKNISDSLMMNESILSNSITMLFDPFCFFIFIFITFLFKYRELCKLF